MEQGREVRPWLEIDESRFCGQRKDSPRARKQELLRPLDTHILGQVELVGRYQR